MIICCDEYINNDENHEMLPKKIVVEFHYWHIIYLFNVFTTTTTTNTISNTTTNYNRNKK